MKYLSFGIILAIAFTACCHHCYAQNRRAGTKKRTLYIYICDEDGKPVRGIALGFKWREESIELTNDYGNTITYLIDEVKPAVPISLTLLQVAANRDWELSPISPPLTFNFNAKQFTLATTIILRNLNIRRDVNRLKLQTDDNSELLSSVRQSQATFTDDMQLGHNHYSYGRFTEALVAYKKAHEKKSDDDSPLFYIAITLGRLEKTDDAIIFIEKCLAIRKTKSESLELAYTHENYALLLRRKNLKEASDHQFSEAQSIRERIKVKQGGNQ